MTRLHVVVRGRVQGVGFRWFVREIARDLDLAGWVMNRADGGVEVAAEGSAGAVDRLRAALARGPARADVSSIDDIDALEAAPGALHRPFSISR